MALTKLVAAGRGAMVQMTTKPGEESWGQRAEQRVKARHLL